MGPGELRASEKNAIALNERCARNEKEISELRKNDQLRQAQIVSLEQQIASLRGMIAATMGNGPTSR